MLGKKKVVYETIRCEQPILIVNSEPHLKGCKSDQCRVLVAAPVTDTIVLPSMGSGEAGSCLGQIGILGFFSESEIVGQEGDGGDGGGQNNIGFLLSSSWFLWTIIDTPPRVRDL